ncbi:MAG: hypothetical protein ABIF08_02950 [Nanoarchaeota archaeon]
MKNILFAGILFIFAFSIIGSVSAVQDDPCDTSNPEGYGCMRLEWICWDAPFINIFIDTTCYSSRLGPDALKGIGHPDSDCKNLTPLMCYNDNGVATHQARMYLDCDDCEVIKGCCYGKEPGFYPRFIGFTTEEKCRDFGEYYSWSKDCKGADCFQYSLCESDDVIVYGDENCIKHYVSCSEIAEGVDSPHCEQITGNSAECRCDPGIYKTADSEEIRIGFDCRRVPILRSLPRPISPTSGWGVGPFIDALPQISIIVIAALACLFVYVMTTGKFVKRHTKRKGKRKK